MLANTKVAVTAIITVGLVIVVLVGTLGVLAWRGADASTVLSLVATLVSTLTLVRTYQLGGQVAQVQQQTNGTQSKLIDHALGAKIGGTDGVDGN